MGSKLFIEIYWVFPRLLFGIVAYAFTLFWTTFVENDCILYRHSLKLRDRRLTHHAVKYGPSIS